MIYQSSCKTYYVYKDLPQGKVVEKIENKYILKAHELTNTSLR